MKIHFNRLCELVYSVYYDCGVDDYIHDKPEEVERWAEEREDREYSSEDEVCREIRDEIEAARKQGFLDGNQ